MESRADLLNGEKAVTCNLRFSFERVFSQVKRKNQDQRHFSFFDELALPMERGTRSLSVIGSS
jgi:hypothetical protein